MTVDESPRPRRGIPPDDAAAGAPGRRWATDQPPEVDAPGGPVLPPSSAGASAGRRFSADELPDDWTGRRFSADELPDDWTPPAPRRSATSPTELDRPSPTSDAATEFSEPDRRPGWVWALIVGALLIALVAMWVLVFKPSPALVVPPPTATAASLIQPAEFAAVRSGTEWTPTDDLAPDETRGLRCVSPGVELQPAVPLSGKTIRRTLTSATGEAATVIQQVESYSDATAAAAGFASRLAQLGGCPATPDLVKSGFEVTGLGEQAAAVRVTEQVAKGADHELLLVRAGSFVTIVDATSVKVLPLASVARAVQPSVSRLCEASGSTCPADVMVGPASTPPAGASPGFLTSGDLPRVTPGAGVWIGARIDPVNLSGSDCEGVDLTKVPKATASAQHAFVLKEDPSASANFGLDEVIYTFSSAADAKAFGAKLRTNLTDCSKQKAAATVTPLGTLPAPAVGQLFTVDLRTSLDRIARSRVLVGVEGTRVVYLAANPTPRFDLKDAAWLGILDRALDRSTQLP